MIYHIRAIWDESMTWCGEQLNPNEPHFKSIDAAALNGLHFTTIENCFKCTECAVESIRKAQAGRKYK